MGTAGIEPAPRGAPVSLCRALRNGSLEPLETLRPPRAVQLVSSLGLERAVLKHQSGVLACRFEPQRDHGLLVVWVGLLPHERVDETARRFDLAKLTAEVERISLRRLHRDSVAASFPDVELQARGGETVGTPPLCELLSFDAGLEHTLGRRGKGLLQMQRPRAFLLGHPRTTSISPLWPA